MTKTYKIVRFEDGKPAQILATDLSYSQVKEWNKNGQPKRGDGWMEGWAESEHDFSDYFGIPIEVISKQATAKD